MSWSQTLKLKTLTPLWTGGVNGDVDRIHETAIIGGLRWWFEALVRGVGGNACDPTKHKCQFDIEKYRESQKETEREKLQDAGLCDVCQVFGATGWRRRFSIRITLGEELADLFDSQSKQILLPSGRIHKTRKGNRAGGWFLFSNSKMGEVEVVIQEFDLLRKEEKLLLKKTIELINQWGALGAKTSNGYGVVRIIGKLDFNGVDQQINIIEQSKGKHTFYPDLQDFFFAKLRFSTDGLPEDWWKNCRSIKEAVLGKIESESGQQSLPPLRKSEKEVSEVVRKGIIPLAPAIRNFLRFQSSHGLNISQERFIFGHVGRMCPNCFSDVNPIGRYYNCKACNKIVKKDDIIQAIGSKIHISHAYPVSESYNIWEVRIWGWLPTVTEIVSEKNRIDFIMYLEELLKSKGFVDYVFCEMSPNIKPELVFRYNAKIDDFNSFVNIL